MSTPYDKFDHYGLRHFPAHLIDSEKWDTLEKILTDLHFLEVKCAAGMVFDLAGDYTRATSAVSTSHAKHRILRLLGEAIRRDISFIARHPTVLFQCLWNTCWWYDCPEAAKHYETDGDHVQGIAPLPWQQPGPKLYHLLEAWERQKRKATPDLVWVRSLRPPVSPIGSPCKTEFHGHQGAVGGATFSPDGRLVASCCHAGTTLLSEHPWTALIWDVETGQELVSIQYDRGVQAVQILADSRRVVTGANDGKVRVFDLSNGRELIRMGEGQSHPTELVDAPDGRHVAAGLFDGTVSIWDINSGSCVQQIHAHTDLITGLDYAPQGKAIVSCSRGGEVKRWNTETGHCDFSFHLQAEPIVAAFVEDGKQIGIVTCDGQIWRCDAASGDRLASVRIDESPSRAAFARSSRRVATGNYEGLVRLWDYSNGQEISRFHGHQDSINALAFSQDSQKLVSGSSDEVLRIWDLAPGEVSFAPDLPHHKEQVAMMQLSPNGLGVMSSSFQGDAIIWGVEDGRLHERLQATIMGRTPSYRQNAWRADQSANETAFSLAGSGLPPVWFQERLDILLPHPFGNLFAGSLRRNVYLLKLEGQKAYTASRLGPYEASLLADGARTLKLKLDLALESRDWQQYLKSCEQLIEIYLALDEMTAIGNVLEECGRLMEGKGNALNAIFFLRHAEEIWRRDNNKSRLVDNLAIQQRVKSRLDRR